MFLSLLRGITLLPNTPAERVGLFVYAVGLFGLTRSPVVHHIAMWGVVPLDWFFLGLVLLGGIFLTIGYWQAEHPEADIPQTFRQKVGIRLRSVLWFFMIVGIVVWALHR